MEYKLKVNQAEKTVNLLEQQEDKLTVAVGENRYQVRYTAVSEHRLHLSIDREGGHQALNVHLVRANGSKLIAINGAYYELADLDAPVTGKRKNGGSALPDTITPPMPAVVVACSVQVGDQVVKGQEVVVVSAMKMETTLVAPFDGTVTAIQVAEGDKVAPGDILVDIDPEETDANDAEDGARDN